MGLMDLFGRGAMSEKRIDKSAKLAANPFAQPDVRMREMVRLIEDGTPAALRGVLKRFAANASGHIADEDEKKWLEDALVECGEIALEPLRAFIKTESKLTYALHAYERIAGAEEAVRFFLEVLVAYGPEDHRALESKLQLVHTLTEHLTDARVLPGLAPFVLDHGDEVRWAVLDALERAIGQGLSLAPVMASLSEGLAILVTDEGTGPRLQRRAAELLAKHEWPVGGTAEKLTTMLDPEFFIDKKRFVRRRVK